MDGILDWMAAGLPTEGTLTGRRTIDVVRRDVPTCHLEEQVGSVRERVRTGGWDVCVVVNQEGIVMGLLRAEELEKGDTELVETAMRPGPSTFRPHVPIETMAHYMLDHDLPTSPITTSEGRLVGISRREDALNAAHGGHDHAESETEHG